MLCGNLFRIRSRQQIERIQQSGCRSCEFRTDLQGLAKGISRLIQANMVQQTQAEVKPGFASQGIQANSLPGMVQGCFMVARIEIDRTQVEVRASVFRVKLQRTLKLPGSIIQVSGPPKGIAQVVPQDRLAGYLLNGLLDITNSRLMVTLLMTGQAVKMKSIRVSGLVVEYLPIQ